jgi:hypothetical protein
MSSAPSPAPFVVLAGDDIQQCGSPHAPVLPRLGSAEEIALIRASAGGRCREE